MKSQKTMRIKNTKLCSVIKIDFDMDKLNKPRNFYDKSFHNHKVISEGGYLEKESIELLQDFFRNKR